VELEGQAAPEVPQEEVVQPSIDPRQAIEVAAQQFGVTPDYLEGALRLQDENRRVADENKRRQRELEVERIKLDALMQDRQRFQPQQPTYDDVDPVTRRLFERLDRIDQRDQERERRQEEQSRLEAEAKEKGEELHGHFESLMRGVPTQSQVDAQRFFGVMAELWPEGPPPGINPQRAVEITAKYLGLGNGSGGASQGYPRQIMPRDPRAQIVIPGAPAPTSMTQQNGDGNDMAPRPGENMEQYGDRMRAWWSGKRARDIIPEGGKVVYG
jgi:hypothetical protein